MKEKTPLRQFLQNCAQRKWSIKEKKNLETITKMQGNKSGGKLLEKDVTQPTSQEMTKKENPHKVETDRSKMAKDRKTIFWPPNKNK